MYGDLPFTMKDVAGLIEVKPAQIKKDGTWDCDCLFCGAKKKMNIDFAKNVFVCPICGEGGGMLDFYGHLFHVDRGTACKEIKEALGLGIKDKKRPPSKKKPEIQVPPSVPQSERAPVEKISETFTALLRMLPLTPTHEQKLLERGFTEEQIIKNGYKSTPAFGLKKLAERLVKAGCTVKGVPGFYLDQDGKWTINFHTNNSGFLVPVRNFDGQILGMQIRADRPHKDRKYIWLSSSGYHMGVTSGSPVHFVGNEGEETVFVTEGPLKADLAHALSGRTFVAVAGVNLYHNLPPVIERLKAGGTKLLYEAYDMDKLIKLRCLKDCQEKCEACELKKEGYKTALCPKKAIKRKNIQNGCKNLYRICREKVVDCKSLTWDQDGEGEWSGNIKGIDDYLVSLQPSNDPDKK